MKKAYEKPEAKKVNYQYNKVVAQSPGTCYGQFTEFQSFDANQSCTPCSSKPGDHTF